MGQLDEDNARLAELRKSFAALETSGRLVRRSGNKLAPVQTNTDYSSSAKDVQIKTQDSPPSLSPTKSASSAEPHQPRPAPAIPTVQTFGEDPSAFDDPTTYHIRDINAATSEEEKKDILGVSEYPHSDLYDLTPGTPPDRDYSAGKSTSQVTALTYSNYLESWIRPITNEDLAFLDERVSFMVDLRVHTLMM